MDHQIAKLGGVGCVVGSLASERVPKVSRCTYTMAIPRRKMLVQEASTKMSQNGRSFCVVYVLRPMSSDQFKTHRSVKSMVHSRTCESIFLDFEEVRGGKCGTCRINHLRKREAYSEERVFRCQNPDIFDGHDIAAPTASQPEAII